MLQAPYKKRGVVMSDLLEGKDVGDEVVIFDWLRVRNMEHRRARLATISRVTPKYVEISIDGIPFNENMTNKRNGFFKKDMGIGRYGTLSLANKESLKQVAEFKLVIKKA